jgi:hypothetical protein
MCARLPRTATASIATLRVALAFVGETPALLSLAGTAVTLAGVLVVH